MTVDELKSRATISVVEAGSVLGIGRDAAYAAAARGEIPTLKFGRQLRVPVPLLLNLLGLHDDVSTQPTDTPKAVRVDTHDLEPAA